MNNTDFAAKFGSVNTNAWQIHTESDLVHAVRRHNGQLVTVEFSQGTSGKWTVRFPRYSFKSKLSHFCPAEADIRMYNNKSVIVSLVSQLKRSGLWSEIENQKFFVVNLNNAKSDKSVLRNLHRGLLKKAIATPAKASKAVERVQVKPKGVSALKAAPKPSVQVRRVAAR